MVGGKNKYLWGENNMEEKERNDYLELLVRWTYSSTTVGQTFFNIKSFLCMHMLTAPIANTAHKLFLINK